MFETEIFEPCLVQKSKWGGEACPPGFLSGYAPDIYEKTLTLHLQILIFLFFQF